jgi:regulator of protease activity HflC (stomatin/prohibitin superfamily)
VTRLGIAYVALAAVAAAALAALVLELRAGARPGPEQVALRFIHTAVQRDHGDRAATLVTDELRGGSGRKAWEAGLLRIVPFPERILEVKLKVLSRTAGSTSMAVRLLAASNASTFLIELRLVSGRWLVDYWGPAMLIGAGS